MNYILVRLVPDGKVHIANPDRPADSVCGVLGDIGAQTFLAEYTEPGCRHLTAVGFRLCLRCLGHHHPWNKENNR